MFAVSSPASSRAATSSASDPQSGSPRRRVPTRPFFLRISVKPRARASGSCLSAVSSSSASASRHVSKLSGAATRLPPAEASSNAGRPGWPLVISRGTTSRSAPPSRFETPAADSSDAAIAAASAQMMTSLRPGPPPEVARSSESRATAFVSGSRTRSAASRAPAEMRRSLACCESRSRFQSTPMVAMAARSIASPLSVPSAAARAPTASARRPVAPKYVAIAAPAKSAGHAKRRSLANGASVSSRRRASCVNLLSGADMRAAVDALESTAVPTRA
mmetsp:Transcript_40409/g.94313  ORF Transcript_40409/g.94313 Transcript_40409/m.94313 type:complete len:276 (+) Transcript_40409:507-1334(+)